MFQQIKALFIRVMDFLLRWRNIFLIKFVKKRNNGDSSRSDSQKTFYENTTSLIVNSNSKFNCFRRIYTYREIVENVTYRQGQRYLERITMLGFPLISDFSKYFLNDSVGKPILYRYPNIGQVSPTTLRYISVSLEIKKLFGDGLSGNIVEIGAGYGGQASMLMEFFKITKYGVYDLDNVQVLIKKYLAKINKENVLKIYSLSDNSDVSWDLAISNYAFSELPRDLQKEYIIKVLGKSQRGYMIMNSGLKNETRRSNGKLTLDELRNLLPKFEVIDEDPNTGPDNYVIVWGHNQVVG
jgi:putative sugar O-methyltransferase